MNSDHSRKIYLFLIVLVLLLGVGIRWSNLHQVTHVDDLAVVNDLYNDINFERYQQEFLHNESYKNYGTPRFKVIRAIDNTGFFDAISSTINHNPFRFVKLFITMTYAPLQFILTQFLVSESFSYATQVMLARLPSVLMSILAVWLFWLCVKTYEEKEKQLPIFLVGLSILFLSWSYIIQSTLAYPYAAGVTALFGAIYLLFKEGDRKRTFWGSLGIVLLLLILVCLQYQLVMFLPALLLCIIYKYRHMMERNKKHIILIAILFGIVFAPIFFLKVYGVQTIHWNAGPEQEFVFPDQVGQIPEFLLKNSFIVFMNLASFAPEDNILFIMFSVVLMTLFLIGWYSLVMHKQSKKRLLGYFMSLSILTFYALVIVQKIALSPTRHSIILLPFLVLAIPEGLFFLKEKYGAWVGSWGSITITVIIILFCISTAPQVIDERTDVFSEETTLQFIENADRIVVDSMTLNLHLMPSVKEKFTYDKETSSWKKKQGENKELNTVVWLSSREYDEERKANRLLLSGINISDYRVDENFRNERDVSFEWSARTVIGTNLWRGERYTKINKGERAEESDEQV